MFWRPKRTLYLVKANNDLVSWCKCRNAPIGLPRQQACPWCGCGWLFICVRCGKAFTFAKAVLVPQSLQKLAELQVPIIDRVMNARTGEITEHPVARTPEDWCQLMRPLLAGLVAGRTYVYFDGAVIPTESAGVKITGRKRAHDLPLVPQVQALDDPSVEEKVLGNIDYWTALDPQ